jgi:hypothetical protein
VENG